MSFALPAASGASLALQNQPVICLIGDAGLSMVLGELSLLKQTGLPVICIVLNDGAIDLIRAHQVRVGKPVYGTEFDPPNYTQIGAAFGIESVRVESEKSFDRALDAALARSGPTLIEVMLDPTSYPTTPAPAKKQ
jgi:thiamine pyrophosphate-dependent acetolactate synthase large subunit-like protein